MGIPLVAWARPISLTAFQIRLGLHGVTPFSLSETFKNASFVCANIAALTDQDADDVCHQNQMNASTAPALTFVLVFIGLLLSRLLKAVPMPVVTTPRSLVAECLEPIGVNEDGGSAPNLGELSATPQALPPTIQSDSAMEEMDRREFWWHTPALLHHLNMQEAPQPCEEKKRLRAAYAEALNKLSEATAVLRWAQYGPELLDALEKTQQARTKHDNARRALEDHRNTHGC